jgi:hypothetical protein
MDAGRLIPAGRVAGGRMSIPAAGPPYTCLTLSSTAASRSGEASIADAMPRELTDLKAVLSRAAKYDPPLKSRSRRIRPKCLSTY